MSQRHEWLDKAEDIADQVLKGGRKILPTVARTFIISTFIEDSAYLILEGYTKEVDGLLDRHSYGKIFCHFIVLSNLLLTLAGVGLILTRRLVEFGVGALAYVLLNQSVVYGFALDIHAHSLQMRYIALFGGLLLLFAETRESGRSLFAGVPKLGDTPRPLTAIQLAGRILIVCMFFSIAHFHLTLLSVLQDILIFGLLGLVCVGYKARLSAMTLVVCMLLINCYNHPIFTPHLFEINRYDFFQDMAVIGGLMLVVVVGPGAWSLDELKKDN